MRFSLLILLLFSFKLSADTKHIVFQLNGTLVYELNGKSPLPREQVAVISEFREVRQFAVLEGVSELLYALYSRPDVVLHFADSDAHLAQNILDKIRVNGKYRARHLLNRSSSKVFNIPFKGSINFKGEFGGDDFIFISTRARDEQVTDTGHLVKVSGAHSAFLAAAIILPQLSKKDFSQQVSLAQKENNQVLLARSAILAKNLFLERVVKFKGTSGHLQSCSVFNLYTQKTQRDLSLLECSNYFGEHLQLTYDLRNKTCDIYTPAQVLKGIYLDSCLKLKKYQTYYSHDLKICSAFDSKNRKLADLTLSQCQGLGIYVYEPQNKTYLFGEYKSAYQTISLEKIIRDLWPLPQSNDLLKVWFPWQRDHSVGFAWRNCVDDLQGGHPIRSIEENSACRGDTFYSWGSMNKIESLKRAMSTGRWQDKMQALYLARTPMGSFGYGPYAVRVKVRSDVSWKKIEYGVTPCSTERLERTIYFRTKPVYESALFDIIICSPQVIESWSYGTKEHYDEMVKDVEWTFLNKRSEENFEMYINDPRFLNESGIDGMDFRIEGIYPRLKSHLQLSQDNSGEIFVNPLFKRTSDHFQTNYPIYFNEQ